MVEDELYHRAMKEGIAKYNALKAEGEENCNVISKPCVGRHKACLLHYHRIMFANLAKHLAA